MNTDLKFGRGLALALACAAGAALLAASQFVDIFYLASEGPRPIEAIGASSQHGLTNVILAALALLLACLALVAGSHSTLGRLAFGGIAIAGLVGLLVFALIDLPDVGSAGTLDSPTGELTEATVEPAAGFWMELFGSLLLLATGAIGAFASRDEPEADSGTDPGLTSSGSQRAAR